MTSTAASTAPPLAVVVIGAGQAGLSAAWHLLRLGLRPWDDVVVLDGNDGPGGAWRHRWDSLTFDAAHGIHDLPGFPLATPDPAEPARDVVTRYYGQYETNVGLPVERPVPVAAVTRDEDGVFTVAASDGRSWRSRAVINATGTWTSPYVPWCPGIDAFTGRQLHTRGYTAAEDFRGQRVLVVGGGTSAAQFVLDLDRAGVETVWSTRRTPDWTDRPFDKAWGRDVETAVTARTTRGLPTHSVVAATGLPLGADSMYVPAVRSGLLFSRGPLRRLTPHGAVLDGPQPDGHGLPTQGPVADRLVDHDAVRGLPGHPVTRDGEGEGDGATGWEVPVETVLWATGFRAALGHLSGLRLRECGGGITVGADGVTVVRVPGLFLVGYGASASTIGATRAGRKAARAALSYATGQQAEATDETAEPATA